MSFFGQNPNAWFGSSPVFATYPPHSEKSPSSASLLFGWLTLLPTEATTCTI